MKRISAFILILIYLVTSTGVTMHHHYCMGEMANSSILADNKKNCGECGMEKKENKENGCCTDEQQWVKIEDDQKANTSQLEISKLQLAVINFLLFNNNLFDIQDNSFPGESKTPLRSCEIPTYLLNCVFRI